ncbi:MAG: regulatory iron-sulfur-containing complex subunit RicT [Bacteroidales bacterium]|nr:regulatory iron-sulfur-containing complex subunit RicT [Bacteroidales bacterium]
MSSIDNGGGCNMNAQGCSKHTDLKLDTFDWLCDVPGAMQTTDLVEVTFKNTRKGYFRNTNNILLEKGDWVTVEAMPGHDIGRVSLLGPLVLLQMKKNRVDPNRADIKRIFRKSKQSDLDHFEEVKACEQETMIKARKIAEDLNLNMKIGDVEFQGDGNKAIFYYIADERVDFRQLIRVLADTFKVRIEMRQIGARQEAGRIGGIGPCGRALCCSSWMSNFVSVSTSSARYQDISPNPQKLAGQCAKLKCCMNFEVDTYLEAQKEFPPRDIQLETLDGTYYHFKSDILARTMQYSTAPNMAVNLVTLTVDEVKAIIERNKRGEKVEPFGSGNKGEQGAKTADYENVVGQDDLTRFDKKKKKKNKNRNKEDRQRNVNAANNGDAEAQNQQNAPENPSANSMPNNANGEQAKTQEGNQQNGENGNNNRNRDRNQQKNRQPRNENGNQQNGENNGGQPNGENGGNNNNRNRNQHRRNKNHNNGNRQNNGQQAGGQQNNNGGNQNSNNNGGGSNE